MQQINFLIYALVLLVCGCFSPAVFANGLATLNQGHSGLGYLALAVFIFAYLLVVLEEYIKLRKSKPMIFAAALIWIIVAVLALDTKQGDEIMHAALNHNLLEYASLLLFLMTAMVYVNALTERNVFEVLRFWLIKQGFSYRQLFWVTGFLAFFISPVADNLTTALLLGAVVMAVGAHSQQFVSLAFINIVVAANAGGAFSPFGDITTLMVWQSGNVHFFDFFELFIPAFINFFVPAVLMSFALSDQQPATQSTHVKIKPGGYFVCWLFGATIITAICFEQFLHLPPYLGMMMGLSYLLFYSYYLTVSRRKKGVSLSEFSMFNRVAKAQWDTLLFFFGVIFCVGGLGAIGYLTSISSTLYQDLGPTAANIIAGLLSAVIDNIPVMFAVLSMEPTMDTQQWLLVTMTAGVGGSLLSVGSAAGVALMGQSQGMYSFFSHLKWSWAIALGYAASIGMHLMING